MCVCVWGVGGISGLVQGERGISGLVQGERVVTVSYLSKDLHKGWKDMHFFFF